MGGVEAPTVTFVPGFMQRGEAWEPVAGRLAASYRSTCLDFDTWTFEERIGELLEAATPGSAVVGYSMGGRLALRAALSDPRAFRALVLLGATPGVEEDGQRRSRRAADDELADWMERSPIQAVVDHWERQAVLASQSPELVERQRRGRLSHEPERLAAMLRATGQGVLPPVWDQLHKLSLPVLAVAGESDDKYVQIAERMAAELPQGRAAIIPQAGHAAHLEQPEEFSDLLLDFLDEHLG